MAVNRNTFGIRTSLGRSMLDSQIQMGGSVALSVARKPITVGTFIYTMLGIFGFAVLFSDSVIRYGGMWGIILFILGYIGTYTALLTRTKTINYRLSYLPVIFRYWRKGGRDVKTGLLDKGGPLKNLLEIDPENPIDEDGTIHFTDGEVGCIFDVTGNASSMIFNEDQMQVINDARTIYKNLPSMAGLTLITQASNQDVHLQLQSKIDQLNHLAIQSPGLRQIVKKQGQILRDTVGSSFSMIRQYLLIRGKPDQMQMVARMIYQAANSATNDFLKEAHLLTNEPVKNGPDGLPLNEPYQVEKFLASIFDDYKGK